MPNTTRVPDAASAPRAWSRPHVECLETRPEITAYSGGGDGGPWWPAIRPATGDR